MRQAAHRYAVLALLQEGEAPALYIIPTLDWLEPSPPLASRDYVGQASEPEYGVEIATSALPALNRYAWTSESEDLLSR